MAITTDRLGKQPDVTVVQIIDNLSILVGPGGAGYIGDDPVFALTIRVTQGTSTKAQTAAFQADAHATLTAALGAEAGPNYVVVEEVPAANWGSADAPRKPARTWRRSGPSDWGLEEALTAPRMLARVIIMGSTDLETTRASRPVPTASRS